MRLCFISSDFFSHVIECEIEIKNLLKIDIFILDANSNFFKNFKFYNINIYHSCIVLQNK